MADEVEKVEGGEEGADKAPTKKKIPLMLLLGVAQLVLTLGAGGLIAKVALSKKPELQRQDLQERAIASIKDIDEDIQTVSLEPFTVNTSLKKIMKTTLEIEVSNPEVTAYLKNRMPMIRAQIIDLLSRQNIEDLKKVQGKLLLKDVIRETLNDELLSSGKAKGFVRDIYFVEFLMI
jgi:flagellar FliL protein